MSGLRKLSVELERLTGYDSIPTIKRRYGAYRERGPYTCVWPGCGLRRRDPEAMWRHVHFGKHGLSFGVRTPEEAAEKYDMAARAAQEGAQG